MKRLSIILIVVLIFALTASLVRSQDARDEAGDYMVLENDAFDPRTRPPVKFTHDGHMDQFQCLVCHHDFQDYESESAGDEGTPCSDCHTKTGGKALPVTLMQAFHGNCKGCHENRLQGDRQTGPVMCGGCHIRGLKAE